LNNLFIERPDKLTSLKIGEIFVKEGLINPSDIDTVLSIQQKHENSPSIKATQFFGTILCSLNRITPVENYWVLHKYRKMLSLFDALVEKNMVSDKKLAQVYQQAEDTKIPVFGILLKQKVITKSLLQRLVYEYYHVPYRSISDFVFHPDKQSELCRVIKMEEAHEHSMIPLLIKKQTMLVGITSPENMLFVYRLNQKFPQYHFKVLFIPYLDFFWFYKLLYNQKKTGQQSESGTIETVPDVSLLLKFETELSDPRRQIEFVRSFYHRYELLRKLILKKKQEDRSTDFIEFIMEKYDQIAKEYKCKKIRFKFKKTDGRVDILAKPVGGK